MLLTIQFDKIWQSITEFWMPTVGWLVLLFLFFLLIAFVKSRNEK